MFKCPAPLTSCSLVDIVTLCELQRQLGRNDGTPCKRPPSLAFFFLSLSFSFPSLYLWFSVAGFQLGCCICQLHLTELDSSSFMQCREGETNTLRLFSFSLLRKCRKWSSPVAGSLSACPPLLSAAPRIPVSAPPSHWCCQALISKSISPQNRKGRGSKGTDSHFHNGYEN